MIKKSKMGNTMHECDYEECDHIFCLTGEGIECPNEECGRIYCDYCGGGDDYYIWAEDGRCVYCTLIVKDRVFTIQEKYSYLLDKNGSNDEILIEELRETLSNRLLKQK